MNGINGELLRLQAELLDRDVAISHHLELIERMAEERHMLHGAITTGFWGCSHQPCKQASRYLREQPKHFSCRVRAAGLTDPPQDCDWPFCGCDPAATRVLNTIEESGMKICRQETGGSLA